MSYRLDLDEYDESQLKAEIQRRVNARAKGLCDYCGRKPTTKSCKFPGRHKASTRDESSRAFDPSDPDAGGATYYNWSGLGR